MPMDMSRWRPDFLDGFEVTDLPLPDALGAAGEPGDTELVATMIRKAPAGRSRSAVLYLHGWNDYFFQTHLAERMTDFGYDFYALDLRRYGRSLRPGQLRGFVTDLDEYEMELDLAAELITEDHDKLILVGHSTGGLVAALWAARRPDRVAALILNSPWLDVQGVPPVTAVGSRLVNRLGTRLPASAIPLPDLGLNVRNVHTSYGGEWDYDLGLKTAPSPPVRVGWLRAIRRGHALVAGGLDLPMPVLVLLSDTHRLARTWHEGLRSVDTVLDVDRIARRAVQLGRHVTVVRIPGAMHDVVLSAPPVREHAFAEIGRWCTAYG
jgi:alpha-beta hydrolase superfamily lysophospholipase